MRDSLLVSVGHSICDLHGNRQRLLQGDGAPGDAIGECRPLYQLKHEDAQIVRLFQSVNGWVRTVILAKSTRQKTAKSREFSIELRLSLDSERMTADTFPPHRGVPA